MPDLTDVRIFIPRIRRELDPGTPYASAASGYTDDVLKDVAADSVNEISLVVGPVSFPYIVYVSSATPASATAPQDWEYNTDPAVPLLYHGLIAVQAAINQLYVDAQSFKTMERIADEGSTWEWQKSANLLQQRINILLQRRKDMIDRIVKDNPELSYDSFENLLSIREPFLDVFIEPYAQ
jgi:hypothetical protein